MDLNPIRIGTVGTHAIQLPRCLSNKNRSEYFNFV